MSVAPDRTGDGTSSSGNAEIEALICRWIAAIQARDLDGVCADHTSEVVMFDVPPPERGARGLERYRDTWPQFFDWLRSGARFELDELEVTGGSEVAYAWALLRCGKDDDLRSSPDRRLRLTLGFRRDGGVWRIAHEHHSFTHTG